MPFLNRLPDQYMIASQGNGIHSMMFTGHRNSSLGPNIQLPIYAVDV